MYRESPSPQTTARATSTRTAVASIYGLVAEQLVRGYMDRGTTTAPFDLAVLNEMSRYHLAIEALKHVPRLRSESSEVIDLFTRKLSEHSEYIRQHLEDMPEIRNWCWILDFSEPDAPPPLAKGHPHAGVFTNSWQRARTGLKSLNGRIMLPLIRPA